MPLGGVFVIDVLGIPMELKVVKQWTLENLGSSTQLQYLGYPIPAVGQSAPSAQQLLNLLPFEIDIFIPKFIIHWNPNPEIGWWDSRTEYRDMGNRGCVRDLVQPGNLQSFISIHQGQATCYYPESGERISFQVMEYSAHF